MELTIDQVKLYQPYRLAGLRVKDKMSFMIVMDRKKKPLILEHNFNINSVAIHRWRTEKEIEIYNLEEYKNLQYVIKVLFEATHFIVSDD